MSLIPERKVGGGAAIGVPLGIILVWVVESQGVHVPTEVATAIGALLTFLAGYLIPNPK